MKGLRRWMAWSATMVMLAGLIALTAFHIAARPSLALATRAAARNDRIETLRLALDELSSHPGDATSARLAARAYSELLHADRAEPLWTIARRGLGLSLDDQHVRALGLMRSNLREEAVAAYLEILREHPTDGLALRRLATIQWTRGRVDEALPIARRLAAVPGQEIAGLSLQATLQHEAGRIDEALALFRQIVRRDPGLANLPIAETVFWKEFSEDLLARGQAAEVLERITPVAARLSDPLMLDIQGIALELTGDPAGAEASWKRSIAVDPTRATPYRNLGRVALGRNALDDSVANLREAIKREPDSYEPTYNLSLALRRQGHAEAAREVARRAEQIRGAARKTVAPATPAAGTTPP